MAQTLEQFGQSIKAKYPQYADIPDAELGQKMLAKYPQYSDMVEQAPTTPPPSAGQSMYRGVSDVVHGIGEITGGNKIGESLGTVAAAGGRLFQGDTQGAQDILKTQVPIPKLIGDYGKAATTLIGAGMGLPKTILGSAGQFGALGTAQGISEGLSKGLSSAETLKLGLQSGVTSGVLGGIFGLLGKVAQKASAPVASFTSGVPTAAIERASANPEVAKTGVNMSLSEIHSKASDALSGLNTDLSNEFQTGLKTISPLPAKPVPHPLALQTKLIDEATKIAKDMRVNVLQGAKGTAADFSQSALVKAGEKGVVNETLKTLSTWSDFSPAGMQDLAERVGALRNFESGAQTKASPIVGKIYNLIAGDKGLIQTYYPDLATIRTNYHVNREVLDGIENVLNATSEKPTQIQGAVSRLDTLFKENKDEYLNVIKQLSDRSGVDILSLLAGNEFKKVLPGFVRGLGGAGAVGVGGAILNPWLVLLAPLFSPRAVGAGAMNAKAIQNAVGLFGRSLGTTVPARVFQSTSPQSQGGSGQPQP